MWTILSFIFSNLILLINALLLFSFFNKDLNRPLKVKISKLILSLATFLFSQIVIIEIVLGTFSSITGRNFSISIYLIFLVLITLLLFKKIKIPELEKPKISPKIILLSLLLLSPLAIFFLNRLLKTILEIPMEYDSIAYHLPFVVEWLKNGNLLTPYYNAFAGPIGYYPGNFELLMLSRILPFGNDFFATLLNFPIFILLGIAIYSVAKNFKINKYLSLILTALLLYMPLFHKQMGTELTDLFFTLCFTLSIYFIQENFLSQLEDHPKNQLLESKPLTSGKERQSKHNIILFALSLGLLIGTKYLGLIYAIIPLIIFLILNHGKKTILILLITLTLSGSFFYLRNLAIANNPIFPAEIKIFNTVVFQGYDNVTKNLPTSTLSANINNYEDLENFSKILQTETGLPGLLLIFFLFISLFFLGYKNFKNKKLSPPVKLLWLTLFSSFIYFFLYTKAPYTGIHISQNLRYAMPFFILAALTAGLLINQGKKTKIIFSTALILSLLPSLIQTTKSYTNLKDYNWDRGKNFTISYQNWYKNDPKILNLMEAINWLNQNAQAAKIAYTGFNLHYHLYGRQLQREVDYININECLNCRYFEYKNSADSIRRNPHYESWLRNLKAKQKEYLIIEAKPESGIKLYELDWAKNHPEAFKMVLQNGDTYVYRIK